MVVLNEERRISKSSTLDSFKLYYEELVSKKNTSKVRRRITK